MRREGPRARARRLARSAAAERRRRTNELDGGEQLDELGPEGELDEDLDVNGCNEWEFVP